MFEDDQNDAGEPSERALNPADRAKDKSDEFRMHAELVAVFEGHRKFDAELRTNLDPDIAREVQRTIARLEKSKVTDTPLIPTESAADAANLLTFPTTRDVSTNDYHIHRRPGEVMILRWLAGEQQVDTFYERLQAHLDAALNHFRQEERQANEWRQDPQTTKYLDALDALEINMPDRYLRDVICQHNVFVLSTQTADEMDILHLCDLVMGVEARDVVGSKNAPPDEPTEQDRAWFFKLFSLRGIVEGVERMCFFTFMQKAEDSGW